MNAANGVTDSAAAGAAASEMIALMVVVRVH
jgi:hypothetical protein